MLTRPVQLPLTEPTGVGDGRVCMHAAPPSCSSPTPARANVDLAIASILATFGDSERTAGQQRLEPSPPRGSARPDAYSRFHLAAQQQEEEEDGDVARAADQRAAADDVDGQQQQSESQPFRSFPPTRPLATSLSTGSISQQVSPAAVA